MTATALFTDSTWSMPPELALDRGITVLPLQVTAGRVAIEDTGENAEDVERILAEGRNLGTSQPTPAVIEAALSEAATAGVSTIIGLFVSSALSGTCESVRAVADLCTKRLGITVQAIDTKTVAAGTGLAVLAASDVLQAGGSAEDAQAAGRAVAGGARVTFTVPDLAHLRRGGRLPAGKALVGKALGVQPLLRVRDGELAVAETVRGARKASARLIAHSCDDLPSPARVVVLHAGAGAAAQQLAETIAAQRPADEVLIAPISRTLRVHTGPGALGIAAAPRL